MTTTVSNGNSGSPQPSPTTTSISLTPPLEKRSDAMKNDKEVVMVAVTQNGMALAHASVRLRHTREVVKVAVQQNGLALETASYELRADKEVCLIAAKQNIHSLAYADDSVKNEADFMLKIVELNAEALVYASESVRSNSKIVFTAVKQLGTTLEWASKELQNDRKIVAAAVLDCAVPGDPNRPQVTALDFASDDIKADKKFVAALIERNPLCYCGASSDVRSDPEIVLLAAGANPQLLDHFEGQGATFEKFIPQAVFAGGSLHSWVTGQLTARKAFGSFLLGALISPGKKKATKNDKAGEVQKHSDTPEVRKLLARIKHLEDTIGELRAERDLSLRKSNPGKIIGEILPPKKCVLGVLAGPDFMSIRQRIAAFAGVPSGRRLHLLRSLSGSLFRMDYERGPGWPDDSRVATRDELLSMLGGLIQKSGLLTCMSTWPSAAANLLGGARAPPPTRANSFAKISNAQKSDPPPYLREPVAVAVARPQGAFKEPTGP